MPGQELESLVSYEELADLERDFEDVEVEIIRHHVLLSAPLYARRQTLVAKIPNFWPLVFEQAPLEIDQFIQPADSALLLSSLLSVSVEHFDAGRPDGDPRSVAIRLDFAPNEHFADSSLEKRFWYRHRRDGWAGLVSDPVPIRWHPGQDLTHGMLDLAVRAFVAERAAIPDPGLVADCRAALRRKIKSTAMGALSFFAWFGFRGRPVTEEEDADAIASERRRRRGEDPTPAPLHDTTDEDELEIFPDGDTVTVCIVEDLWPGAIEYFTHGQESQENMSDTDFESDSSQRGPQNEVPAAKRVKA